MNTDPPTSQTRPASSAIILRDAKVGFEVFMVVRNHQIDFASGALVFPGGKVDPQDYDGRAGNDEVADSNHAFRMATVRETFEEAGLVLASKGDESQLVGAREARDLVLKYRQDVLQGALSFSDVLAQNDMRPALDLMIHFAHWITPITQPKRFDTHFFIVAAPVDQIGIHDGTESVEGIWISPQQALSDAKAGRRIVLPPTQLNLQKLSQATCVEDAIVRARNATVVTVLPTVEQTDGGRVIHLPIDAGYGVSELFVKAI